MANYEATKYDFDGANIQGLVGITTGSVIPWSDSSIPSGFLECNGTDVSRSTYATLFATIGTTYGSGNGSTTFTLPDIQDDVVIGKSPTKAIASTGGANTVASSGNITGNTGNRSLSGPTNSSHGHSIPGGGPNNRNKSTQNDVQGPGPAAPRSGSNANTGNKGGSGSHSHGLSASFSGSATSVLQPYLTVIYIIKT